MTSLGSLNVNSDMDMAKNDLDLWPNNNLLGTGNKTFD